MAERMASSAHPMRIRSGCTRIAVRFWLAGIRSGPVCGSRFAWVRLFRALTTNAMKFLGWVPLDGSVPLFGSFSSSKSRTLRRALKLHSFAWSMSPTSFSLSFEGKPLGRAAMSVSRQRWKSLSGRRLSSWVARWKASTALARSGKAVVA
jgi:hypothetical protein